MKRYKQNLKVVGDNIYSYNTLVAKIDHFLEYVILGMLMQGIICYVHVFQNASLTLFNLKK